MDLEKIAQNAKAQIERYPEASANVGRMWKYSLGMSAVGVAIINLAETHDVQRVGAYGVFCGVLTATAIAATHWYLSSTYRSNQRILTNAQKISQQQSSE